MEESPCTSLFPVSGGWLEARQRRLGAGGELRGNIAGNTGPPDGLLCIEPRGVLELVDDVRRASSPSWRAT
jgi:hypothetical protein